ncbi:transcriptional regulator domain-containing protein [Polymorphum gilvum]|uniref:Transcriptional regulator-like domain-containing protein n=1 Tax=Polymorphum gilvum (strain LMG 25793 / CGMCC 1.9160 / SL003B-26A1) TaxID=991905 RepID=F2J192_POLGS|nr:hypothetical protein SL003B_0302 [Polymorphum gilvum SL003B-26A1]
MIPDISHWRSSSTYDFIDEIDSPDIAWEWLRRNEKYQTDYRSVVGDTSGDAPATARRINSWGLSFPHSPRPFGDRNPCVLAARARHRRGRARRHPAAAFRRR